MTHTRIPAAIPAAILAAMIISAGGTGAPARAQDEPVDLSGIWWANAPLPLLLGESPSMGMGMGMGPGSGLGNVSRVPLTEEGQRLMAGFDPVDDPAVRCEQPGLVRQILSPYPLEVIHRDGTVIIDYEEWAVQRVIHLGPDAPPAPEPGPLGHSAGEYEGATLVVTTTGLTPGLARIGGFFWTSEQASTVERYSLTERGQLFMELELTDPVMLTEPFRMEKTWNPYDQELLDFDCILRERP